MTVAIERTHLQDRDGGRGVLPWASLIGGGALATYGVWRGIARRSIPGAALAALGGFLVYRGATAERVPREIDLEKSVLINTSPEEAYRFWHNFENLPRFMRHLAAVKSTGPRWSEWVVRTPTGNTISWHAEIVEDRENEMIAWRSRPGSEVDHYGSVRFEKAPDARGTRVTVRLHYKPPAGRGGARLAGLLGKIPEFQIKEDLRRCKALMETGEIPTTEGQPSGRRSVAVSLIHRAKRRYAPEPHWVHAARPA